MTLDFSYEVELEFLNVEGKGGFLNMDPNPLRVANKSARIKVDKAVLTPILRYRDLFVAPVELRANDRTAFVDRMFLRTRWLCIAPHLTFRSEVGKNHPFVRPKRWTEFYSLLGTMFWKGREYHAWSEFKLSAGPVNIIAGATGAQKRPLSLDDVAEDDSFKLLALGDTVKAAVGNNFTYGGKLFVSAYGMSVVGYGFRGKLTDNDDLRALDNSLSGYDELGDVRNQKHHWYGGRAAYDGYGLHVMVEGVRARDGNLPRSTWFAQGFLDLAPQIPKNKYLRLIGPVVHYGKLNIKRLAPDPDEPETWDRKVIMAGMLVGLTEILTLKVEYYKLDEDTGSTKVKDDQLLVQLKVQYGDID